MESGGRMDAADRTVEKRFLVMADFDSAKRGWTKGMWYEATPPISAASSFTPAQARFSATSRTIWSPSMAAR